MTTDTIYTIEDCISLSGFQCHLLTFCLRCVWRQYATKYVTIANDILVFEWTCTCHIDTSHPIDAGFQRYSWLVGHCTQCLSGVCTASACKDATWSAGGQHMPGKALKSFLQ